MKAFEGYRVLDLTHVLAGPFSTHQLAVLGADVIKIEPPGEPDMMREHGVLEAQNEQGLGVMFQTQGTNKRAITLNLKTEQGRDIFKRLTDTADVMVVNYRAGALDALGLGYDDLAETNPRLIYCSITGFGQTGPKAGHTAFDPVIQAYSGLMATTGTPESAPLRVGAPVLDYGTGSQAAFAIAAALLRRERSGQGQRLDVSMLDAALMLMSSTVLTSEITGKSPVPQGNSHPSMLAYGCFPTAAGTLMLGVHTPRQHERLWRALGREDLASKTTGQSHRELEARCVAERPMLAEILLMRSADEWETLLADAGIPAARVRALHETLADPQLQNRAVLQETQTFPGIEPQRRAPISAATWSQDGPEIKTPPPRHGQHTDSILEELGYSTDTLVALRSNGVI